MNMNDKIYQENINYNNKLSSFYPINNILKFSISHSIYLPIYTIFIPYFTPFPPLHHPGGGMWVLKWVSSLLLRDIDTSPGHIQVG